MIYYMRNDSKGRYLLTSYSNVAMAKRVRGMEKNSTKASFWDGDMYFNLETGKYGKDASGVALRGYIKSAGNDGTGGRFAVFSLSDGKPNDLGLRFKEFGAANTFMKNIADSYGELFILEMEKMGTASENIDEDISMSDEAPF